MATETLQETVYRIMDTAFYRPNGGPAMPAPVTRCPICDGPTLHAEGCMASLDPTLPATAGTLLQQTADELERCWTALGQVKPNRHVTDARALLRGAE
jgi:hypothetical protein